MTENCPVCNAPTEIDIHYDSLAFTASTQLQTTIPAGCPQGHSFLFSPAQPYDPLIAPWEAPESFVSGMSGGTGNGKAAHNKRPDASKDEE